MTSNPQQDDNGDSLHCTRSDYPVSRDREQSESEGFNSHQDHKDHKDHKGHKDVKEDYIKPQTKTDIILHVLPIPHMTNGSQDPCSQ